MIEKSLKITYPKFYSNILVYNELRKDIFGFKTPDFAFIINIPRSQGCHVRAIFNVFAIVCGEMETISLINEHRAAASPVTDGTTQSWRSRFYPYRVFIVSTSV